MSIFKEFKDFAIKGNVVDLAVALVIGAAFGKIIASFVGDILMPPLGLMVGVDFSQLGHELQAAVMNGDVVEKEAIILKYGNFIQTCVDFLMVAIGVFAVVKLINSTKKKEEEAAPAPPPANEVLLGEIRDLLKK